MTTDWGLAKLREVLASGSEPHLMTGAQYKESLRDGRRIFDSNGELIEDVTSHPHLTRSVDTVAEIFDLQFAPDSRDVTTYVDEADGRRYATGWQVPTKVEHLHRRRETLRLSTLKTLGVFGRPPGLWLDLGHGFPFHCRQDRGGQSGLRREREEFRRAESRAQRDQR